MSAVLTPEPAPAVRWVRVSVLLVATAAVGAWAAGDLIRSARTAVPIDYLAFWAAGRLNAAGANPYDPVAVRQFQLDAGYDPGEAVMMWNPPWALAVAMPLGVPSPPAGHLLWQLAQFVFVGVAADRLWLTFGGPARRRWVGWLLAFAFAPTVFLVGSGQITSLCLIGVAMFLTEWQRGRPGRAGAWAALTALKPHLLALFGLALLLETTRTRAGRRAVLVGAGVVGLMTAVALAANPNAFEQYLTAVSTPGTAEHKSPADWRNPTIGSYLRSAVGGAFAVQCLPLAVGAVCVGVMWWRRREWDWTGTLPVLVLGSLLVAPYGAWSYDLTLLLVPILATAAKWTVEGVASRNEAVRSVGLGFLPLSLFAVVTLVLFACLLAGRRVPIDAYVWVTPTVAAGLLVVARLRPRPSEVIA